jgi:hypothetical protein
MYLKRTGWPHPWTIQEHASQYPPPICKPEKFHHLTGYELRTKNKMNIPTPFKHVPYLPKAKRSSSYIPIGNPRPSAYKAHPSTYALKSSKLRNFGLSASMDRAIWRWCPGTVSWREVDPAVNLGREERS